MALKNNNEDGINVFQTFSTLLALLLPLLQFFFSLLPSSAQSIFVFKDILIPVTVIAGIFSYLLIIAFKNTSWFSIAFNRVKHREYEEFQDKIGFLKSEPDNVKREQQARQLLKDPKKAPWYLTPHNIYLLLLPLLFIFSIVFLAIGIFGTNTSDKWLILLQSIAYIMTVSLTTLTLAAFYINETNRKNQQALNRGKYQKIVQLLFDNHSIPEFPTIDFVAQDDSDFMNLRTFVRINGDNVYRITTDSNGDILKETILAPRPQSPDGDTEE